MMNLKAYPQWGLTLSGEAIKIKQNQLASKGSDPFGDRLFVGKRGIEGEYPILGTGICVTDCTDCSCRDVGLKYAGCENLDVLVIEIKSVDCPKYKKKDDFGIHLNYPDRATR